MLVNLLINMIKFCGTWQQLSVALSVENVQILMDVRTRFDLAELLHSLTCLCCQTLHLLFECGEACRVGKFCPRWLPSLLPSAATAAFLRGWTKVAQESSTVPRDCGTVDAAGRVAGMGSSISLSSSASSACCWMPSSGYATLTRTWRCIWPSGVKTQPRQTEVNWKCSR